jgi:hypothetical protein
MADDICNICKINDEEALDGLLKHDRSLYSEQLLQSAALIKRSCDACQITFHLGCLLAFKQTPTRSSYDCEREYNGEKHDLVEHMHQFRTRTFLCYACNLAVEQKQLKRDIEKEEQKKLKVVKVNSHTLRMNRARVEK